MASITIPKSKEEVQESMEVLGNTIESFGKSIIGGTTELLSQMKETINGPAARRHIRPAAPPTLHETLCFLVLGTPWEVRRVPESNRYL